MLTLVLDIALNRIQHILKGYIMKTASDITALYTVATVEVDYTKMTKDQLIEVIKDLQSKIPSSDNVGDLTIKMLLDDRLMDASNIVIAEAIRALIPGSETSSKSVSSVRSVYNKGILTREANKLDASLSPRERAMAIAELEYDLMDQGLLIKPRQ